MIRLAYHVEVIKRDCLADASLLALVGVLLGVTVAAAVMYYRLVRRAQFEYDKARELVEDVVSSFNRELKREANKLDTITYKIEGSASKLETATKKIDAVEQRYGTIDAQMSSVLTDNQRVTSALAETNSRTQAIEEAQEALKSQVGDLREQMQKLSAPFEKIEPVIPIKRDKAMASLTDTEIAVLEMLADEGAKTAPEIKERVKLSREHTARLMKKLYQEGYLERETGKIPFKYSVKEEMKKFLKKTETPQT